MKKFPISLILFMAGLTVAGCSRLSEETEESYAKLVNPWSKSLHLPDRIYLLQPKLHHLY